MDTEAPAARENSRQRAWRRRILECCGVTLLLAALIMALSVVGFGSALGAVSGFVLFGAAALAGIAWGSSTGRLLRGGAFHVTGFLLPLLAVVLAVPAGSDGILALTGETATCPAVTVEQMPADMFGNDWRHHLRCPDGTDLVLARTEEDESALRGPLVYQPHDWVPARPLADYRQEGSALLRWAFLALCAAIALQSAAAIIGGLVRRRLTTQHPDDQG